MNAAQLAEAPLGPSALDRTPDLARRGHADPSLVSCHRHHKNHQVAPARSDALPVHPLKIGPFLEPNRSWEGAVRLRRQSACAPYGDAR